MSLSVCEDSSSAGLTVELVALLVMLHYSAAYAVHDALLEEKLKLLNQPQWYSMTAGLFRKRWEPPPR